MSEFTSVGSRGALSIGRPEDFYPSPFFDVSQRYLPKTITQTYDWCTYYFMTNPVVHGTIMKLAAYAITDLVYQDTPLDNKFRDLYENVMNLRTFLVEFNLDRYVYGNAFATVVFPIRKVLICRNPACKKEVEAKRAEYKWMNGGFMLKCHSCDEQGVAQVKDYPIPNAAGARLLRWNPKCITVRKNEITGDTRYFYTMPRYLRNEIQLNMRRTVENTPQAFLEAVAQNRLIEIEPSKIFHAKRPSISGEPADSGLGAPILYQTFQSLFLLQVMRKAQEAIFLEHILPFRSLFPEIRAEGGNAYGNVNLKDWQASVIKEVKQWKRDPNHIAVFPVPIGQQVIGGQGRQLSLYQDMRAHADEVIASMGVPPSLYWGDAVWSGQNVSMRALENEFITNRQDQTKLVDFITRQLAACEGLIAPKLTFKEFKMADDLAKAQMDFQLATAGKISWTTFLAGRGFNMAEENVRIMEDLEAQGGIERKKMEMQASAQSVAMRGQAMTQAEIQAGGPQSTDTQGPQPTQPATSAQPTGGGYAASPVSAQQQPGIPMEAQAMSMAKELAGLPEIQRYRATAQLKTQQPDLYMLVNQYLASGVAEQQPTAGSKVRSLPEQRAPRAGPKSAVI